MTPEDCKVVQQRGYNGPNFGSATKRRRITAVLPIFLYVLLESSILEFFENLDGARQLGSLGDGRVESRASGNL